MSGVCRGGSLGDTACCLLCWIGCDDSKQNPPPDLTPGLSRRLQGLIQGGGLPSVAVQVTRRSGEAYSLGLQVGLLSPPSQATQKSTAPEAAQRP